MAALGGGPSVRTTRSCLYIVSAGFFTLAFFWVYALAAPTAGRVQLVPIAKSVFQHVHLESQPQPYANPNHESLESVNLTYLEKHELSAKFTYRRRAIKTRNFKGERPDLTVVDQTLFDITHIIDSKNLTELITDYLPPITLRVPFSPNNDPSILSFGAATTIPRLNDSLPQFQHWITNTTCPLHIVAPPHDDDLILEREFRAKNINLTVTPSMLPFPKAYFSVIKQLYESRTPNTKWLALIDDDTFVPSLPTLVEHLTHTYDETQEIMLAAISDDLNQVRNFGLIPFGGGGIFFSVPLAARLIKPEIWEKCMENGKDQGDQIVNDCLNDYTSVRPTWDNFLNQMDIRGGEGRIEAGYFESGRRFLTIHHWKSWFQADLPLAAKVSAATGDEGIFMRWLFQENVVLSNGYSVAEYPNGLKGIYKDGNDDIDFRKVEITWPGDGSQWIHKFPLRERLEKENKVTFELKDAETIDGVGVRQLYVHTAEEGGMDGVIELMWLF